MAAQPPPYAPGEPPFPTVQEGYQAVPAQPQQNKPAAAQSIPQQQPSEYTPAPPQYYPGQPAQGVPQQPGYPYVAQSVQNSNVTVVTQQPSVPTMLEIESKPNNYLALSIVNLLCCFFILGIIALVFSLQVDSAWSAGNYQTARHNSNVAKVLNIVGFSIGIVGWVIAGILILVQIIGAIIVATRSTY